MTDGLEREIKGLFADSGPLDRDAVVMLLLQMLHRIQMLEVAQKESPDLVSQG